MSYRVLTRDEHWRHDGNPKRILALDGGGLRGILSLGLLARLEDLLRERHGGGEDFRLAHYFDLIAGTSTGAIIAATLALGWTVEEIRQKYMALGRKVFQKSLLRLGVLRAKYDEAGLSRELKSVYGATTSLGSDDLATGLLIMTKRLDTGSPWPLSNNPRGRYYAARPDNTTGNADYPLWKVVRASTAAPGYFNPESITIKGKVSGEFVDGGVSPFNNPALAAVMYATLDGYRVGWPMAADKLLVVSIGTGSADPRVTHARLSAKHAINALLSLMDDSATLQETLLQWMSASHTARPIDRELGDLRHDLIGRTPLISYLRYNVDLSVPSIQSLDPQLSDAKMIEGLSAMDAPENMDVLHRLGTLASERDIHPQDFPTAFDLSLA
jgi:Patatin-like phospholipase